MASIVRQFALLAWKNWLLTKRRPIVTLLELLFPLILPVVILSLRPFVSSTVTDTSTHYKPFEIDRLPTHLLSPSMDLPLPSQIPLNIWLVAYAPNNAVVSRIIKGAMRKINTVFHPFNTSVPYYYPVGKEH